MTATTLNPLLQQESLPKFASIEASNLTPAMDSLLEKLETDLKSLEGDLSSKQPSSYADVLPKIEQVQFPLGYVWGIASHLNGVKNSDELREAHATNQPRIVSSMSQFSQSKPIYEALDGLDTLNLNRQEARAVQVALRSMKLGGVGLEGDALERFNECKLRLAELSTQFGNHVLDATKAFSLTIDDAKVVEGVPDSAKALWAQAAEAKDAETGPWKITLDMPSYIAVMSHLRDRNVREQVYRAYITRASELSEEGQNSNIDLIYEILQLKQEMAGLLGFETYAEQSLASKMAPSVQAVADLSELIRAQALPAAEQELAAILELAKTSDPDIYANVDKLMPWDTTFWSERLKESKFDLTEEETRPYFALPAVLDGMFALVSRLFQVEVRKSSAEVWNDDVSFFDVYDKKTDKHLASFYLDPYSRPANKRGGAWMDTCIGKSEATKRDVPVAYLVCNGSPPIEDKPSLMTFREVETLFHEFGHGLQHMLTTATVGDVAGINGVEWDAVELPSQFMENWCYDRPTVYGFAKHWETGEPMPESMFEKLKAQKVFNAGMIACRQLCFGQLDMELHHNFDAKAAAEGKGETIFDVHQRIAKQFTPYSMPLPEDRFLCTFSHIFAGGYAAGYFSYKWAEVMSADAFSAFEDVGLDNEEKVQEVGMRFRDTVLSLGGGEDPMTVFKEFRGREPTPDALLRHSGLA